jgi:hypothetical protein
MRGQSILVTLVLLLSIPFLVSGQGASIEQRYAWQYAGRTWSLTHRFSTEHYRFFRTLPRILDYTEYAEYINDSRDDGQLQSLIDELERLAANAGLNVWEKLNLVIAFVQSIPYVSEPCEYPRYPLETLVEYKGDCEDAAILAAALLQQMRFDVVLLAFLEEDHMAIGIRVVPPTPVEDPAYAWSGGTYYYLEPTSVGWEIGAIPVQYRSQPTIVPLRPAFASSGR